MVGQPNLESSDYNGDQWRNRLKIMLLYPLMIMKPNYGEVSQRVFLGSELVCQKPRGDANLAFPSIATAHAVTRPTSTECAPCNSRRHSCAIA
jgi:hypothetical protein